MSEPSAPSELSSEASGRRDPERAAWWQVLRHAQRWSRSEIAFPSTAILQVVRG